MNETLHAAELEDQCDRQRRMLQELAVASEALAKDNVLLSSELVALRDRGEEAEAKVALLTERLTSAQKLYLAGQRRVSGPFLTPVHLPNSPPFIHSLLAAALTASCFFHLSPPPPQLLCLTVRTAPTA